MVFQENEGSKPRKKIAAKEFDTELKEGYFWDCRMKRDGRKTTGYRSRDLPVLSGQVRRPGEGNLTRKMVAY